MPVSCEKDHVCSADASNGRVIVVYEKLSEKRINDFGCIKKVLSMAFAADSFVA